MNRKNVVLGVIVVVWLALLFFFIGEKSKAAGFILPIFTIGAVGYLAYATLFVAQATGLTKNDKESDEETKNK